MKAATQQACQNADVLLMAAAVSDFRPTHKIKQKIKKSGGIHTIEVSANPDILEGIKDQRAIAGCPRVVVGFAAESQDLIKNAQSKLRTKGLDMIVANDISATDSGFGVDTNRVIILHSKDQKEELPLMSKAEVAEAIFDRVLPMLADR
jgi:phosphopantothenoylcysteine decarboxylase/phosphopantothenate--cysteine ligase